MSVIVVTRLRLRDPAFLDEFSAAAVATLEQAKNSEGSLAAMSSPTLTTPGGQAPPGANAARLPSRLHSSDRRRRPRFQALP
jgi:hypothetical protein